MSSVVKTTLVTPFSFKSSRRSHCGQFFLLQTWVWKASSREFSVSGIISNTLFLFLLCAPVSERQSPKNRCLGKAMVRCKTGAKLHHHDHNLDTHIWSRDHLPSGKIANAIKWNGNFNGHAMAQRSNGCAEQWKLQY